MRLFVAVVPPPEALTPLAEALPTLRERWPGMGWVAPERWHLTLAFLGEVAESDGIRAGLAAVAHLTPLIPATMGGGGTFPGGRRVRVAWVAIEAGPALGELAAGVAVVARSAGIEVDERPYRAHLTLARSRREPPADPDDLRSALGVARGREFVIGRLVLLRSHLGPRPRYEEVDAWPFTG